MQTTGDVMCAIKLLLTTAARKTCFERRQRCPVSNVQAPSEPPTKVLLPYSLDSEPMSLTVCHPKAHTNPSHLVTQTAPALATPSSNQPSC